MNYIKTDFIQFLCENKDVQPFSKDEVLRAGQDLGIDLRQYDYQNVMMGMDIEREHGSKFGNDVNITGDQPQPTLKIVIAHLRENPRYYTDVLGPAQQNMVREAVENLKDFEAFTNSLNKESEEFKIAAGVLPICKSTGRVLLAKRQPNVDHGNVWAGFGGKLESKLGESEENVIDVAKREFTEETGYKDFYNFVPSYIYITPKGTFKFYNFIGIFDKEFEPDLNEEHSESKWFSMEEINQLAKEDIHFGVKLLFLNDPDIVKKFAK